MSRAEACLICGEVSHDVSMALIKWRDLIDREEHVTYGSGPRCRDRDGCRRRAAQIGEKWPEADPKEAPA